MKRKIIMISMTTMVVVAVIGIGGKFLGKNITRKSNGKQVETKTENSVFNLDWLSDKDAIDSTSKTLKKYKTKKEKEEREKELKKAKKEYPNWVDGVDIREYINMDKYKDYGIVYPSGKNCSEYNVFIREDAGTDKKKVGIATKNVYGKITGKKKDKEGKVWYKIESGDVKGYIRGDNFKTGEKAKEAIPKVGKLIVTTKDVDSVLNVRAGEGTDKEIIEKMNKGETLVVSSVKKKWVEVYIGGNEKGYISRDYTKFLYDLESANAIEDDILNESSENISNTNNTNNTNNASSNSNNKYSSNNRNSKNSSNSNNSSNSSNGKNNSSKNNGESIKGSGTGVEVARYAANHIGGPYVWGGNSFTNGIDCSGFTKKVYEHFGVTLPRTAATQANFGGRTVSLNSLEPGDLVFYSSGGRIYHVVIYIGGGKVAHAANPQQGVIIQNLWGQPCKAVRIF